MTVRDQWVCELDENTDKEHMCNTLRKAVNCKTTVAKPIKAEVLLRINNKIKASALAFCGWDTAVSEIRFCFIILSFFALYLAKQAIDTNSKKEADIVNLNLCFFLFNLYFYLINQLVLLFIDIPLIVTGKII